MNDSQDVFYPTISTQPPRNREPRNEEFAANVAARHARRRTGPGPRIKMTARAGAGAGARTAPLEFAASDSLATMLRESKRQGFPPVPTSVGHATFPVLPGTTWFQIIDAKGVPVQLSIQIVDLDEAKAKARSASQASAPATPTELTGASRRRSETSIITRTGNLEERRAGDISPRVSNVGPSGAGASALPADVDNYDPVVRIVGEPGEEQMGLQDEQLDDMMLVDLVSQGHGEYGPEGRPVGPEPPSNRLSDRSDVSGKNSFNEGHMAGSMEAKGSIRSSGSGSDVMMFSKSAMSKIEGLAQIIESNPDAFKKTKVKKSSRPLAYTVMVSAETPGGGQVLMEAQPVKADNDDVANPMYQCGYCQSIKTSSSASADGRVRIRCECGGKHQDGKSRMHANWNPLASRPGAPIPALGNARLMAKGPKMPANRNTRSPGGPAY